MGSKILIIDHNDSFTYNLVQLFTEAGAERVDVLAYADLTLSKVYDVDAFVLSPGPGLPEEYPKSLQLIETYAGKKPILGVCMGLQLIVTHFGGDLVNLSTVKHGQKVNLISRAYDCSFEQISSPTPIGLYHSWAMNIADKPECIEITATLQDDTVMAIQHHEFPIKAVQFHPESYMTEQGATMAKNWLLWIEKFLKKTAPLAKSD